MKTHPQEQNDRKGDWMTTYTGKAYWPIDPRPKEVDIIDIAHSLAMQCRFAGHVNFFYSIAQHCVVGAELLLEELNSCPNIKTHILTPLAFLLHDASEAYCHDIIRPLKRYLKGYAEIEELNQLVIELALGLPHRSTIDDVVIDDMDRRMLAAEIKQLCNVNPSGYYETSTEQPLDIQICPWSPEYAKHRYLQLYFKLSDRFLAVKKERPSLFQKAAK